MVFKKIIMSYETSLYFIPKSAGMHTARPFFSSRLQVAIEIDRVNSALWTSPPLAPTNSHT